MTSPLIQPLASVEAFLARSHASFIDGEQRLPGGETRRTLRNPADDTALSETRLADLAQVEAIVQSAHRAFRSGIWSGLTPAERERLLLRFADLVEQHSEELAQLESLNQGKSIHIARAIEVGATLNYMRYMAGWATKIEGQTLDVSMPMPAGARFNAYTRREPAGVVAGIVPWNFPMMIALWKVMPALACGCTIIIKPADETPLTVLRLAELAIQAGIPAGVFNVLLGQGSVAGAALIAHPLVNKVSFTGSTAVGKQVGAAALQNMTRFTLELGGKNPMLVLPDADLDKAVAGAIGGGLLNQGQVCAAASRFFVHASRYDDFVERLGAQVAALKIGAGMDPQAQINPLVSRRQQDSVLGHLARAREQGARVHCGGARPERPGYFVEPTVLADVEPGMDCAREEIFGPVLSVLRYDDLDTAVERINDNPNGLAASIWSNDLGRVMDLIPRIQAGTVWVNNHVPLDPNLPFGGYKQSGIGREFGRAAIEGFTELKSVCITY
ncbi:aldehyde dehydrogenase family protein [Pseudomonas panipatensis]|uniref:Phenylacetaldehyde dehydrogenase n=1 Tax=Pseudomonas panipatensis TaxID=428992 RepID=A0A1G8GC19_9PSED|nr:aldehyde dehydrogenase family protein [Pseudomonas panipatensis]SDH91935.1 phenylacetaldehyde dehydrogenase [Pseudomonas panipatensis]SMP44305.1 phenylacetaldehyde dehydrogenase [Pseudomonas panipatensis]